MAPQLAGLPVEERDLIRAFAILVRDQCADARWEDIEPTLAESWARLHKGGLSWEQIAANVRKSYDGSIG